MKAQQKKKKIKKRGKMKIKMTQGVKERGKSVALNSVDSRSGAKPEKWPLAWAVIVVFFSPKPRVF